METKPLLYGLIGFFIGGFIVAVAATTFDETRSSSHMTKTSEDSSHGMSMDDMAMDFRNKNGDAFDKAFIASMIKHHEGAVAMAELSADQAKHQEIKALSKSIINAQQKEITEMKQWRDSWYR